MYNWSNLENCDILHLLVSDWNNMALLHVSHPHVILFMLLIGFIYFGMYFLSEWSKIHTFQSTVLAPKKTPSEIGNIISLCSSRTNIWGRYFCFFTRIASISTKNEYFTLGECITWGWFSIQECNSFTIFQKRYFHNVSLVKLMY